MSGKTKEQLIAEEIERWKKIDQAVENSNPAELEKNLPDSDYSYQDEGVGTDPHPNEKQDELE